MIRLLAIILIIFIVGKIISFLMRWWLQRKLNSFFKPIVDSENQAKQKQSRPDNMVQCAICGIYTPKTNALEKRGKYYCSRAHFNQG